MSSHHIEIELKTPVTTAVDAGSSVPISVAVKCSSGCDLCGSRLSVLTGGETSTSVELVSSGEDTYEPDGLVITAPMAVEEHVLSVIFESRVIDGVRHEGRLAVPLRTRAHRTSLAAWGIPSTVVLGQEFAISVGATCSAACELGNQYVVVRDEGGEVVARARLGKTPLPGTTALYWSTTELTPPEREGTHSWSFEIEPTESVPAHVGTSSKLSVTVIAPPEHNLIVHVADRLTGEPLKGVRVLLASHRGITDASGMAALELPTGRFALVARKVGYQDARSSVHITGDVTIQLDIEPEPEKDEFAEWM